MKLVSKIAAILLAACLATPVLAENTKRPEIITHAGKAFSWQEKMKEGQKGPNTNPVVVYDVVSAWQNAKRGREPSLANCDKFQTTLKGVTWCFASASNLKKFTAATDNDGGNEFVPFVGGRCTLGVAWGRIDAVGDPRSARVVQDNLGARLVLHSNKKWWPEFNKGRTMNLAIATAVFNVLKATNQVVSNDKLPK